MKPEFRYEVIIYWSDEDQAFVAEFPELLGCAAEEQRTRKRSPTWRSSSASGSKPPRS